MFILSESQTKEGCRYRLSGAGCRSGPVSRAERAARILIQIFRRKDRRGSILLSLPPRTARSRRYPPPTIGRGVQGGLVSELKRYLTPTSVSVADCAAGGRGP